MTSKHYDINLTKNATFGVLFVYCILNDEKVTTVLYNINVILLEK